MCVCGGGGAGGGRKLLFCFDKHLGGAAAGQRSEMTGPGAPGPVGSTARFEETRDSCLRRRWMYMERQYWYTA